MNFTIFQMVVTFVFLNNLHILVFCNLPEKGPAKSLVGMINIQTFNSNFPQIISINFGKLRAIP